MLSNCSAKGGFDTETTARCFRALGYYVVGAALDETPATPRGRPPSNPVTAEDVVRGLSRSRRGQPLFQAGTARGNLRLGLDILLDGMARLAKEEKAGAARGRPRRGSGGEASGVCRAAIEIMM